MKDWARDNPFLLFLMFTILVMAIVKIATGQDL